MERIAVRPLLDAKEVHATADRSFSTIPSSLSCRIRCTCGVHNAVWARCRLGSSTRQGAQSSGCRVQPGEAEQALIPQDKYRPFPTIHDRAWEGLRPQTRSTFLAGVEKSWHRTVKLDRSSNLVEISDSYILTEPVSDITLNLMTACKVTETAKGLLTLTSAQAIPPTLISFDANLLTPTVETIPLENLELKRYWGPQIYRIQLETPGTKTAGKLKLTISQHQ
jgi:hypothetical protein